MSNSFETLENYNWVLRQQQPRGRTIWAYSQQTSAEESAWFRGYEFLLATRVLPRTTGQYPSEKYNAEITILQEFGVPRLAVDDSESRKRKVFQARFLDGKFQTGWKFVSNQGSPSPVVDAKTSNTADFKQYLQDYFRLDKYRQFARVIVESNLPSDQKHSIEDLIYA